ncbi:MAG: phenylacetate--CoA ligase family protein [Acetobacteraceae bacterium]
MLIGGAERADPGLLARHRQECWERQREYVMQASGLCRRLWAGRAVPRRLEDLPTLPLIDKEMLRDGQRREPPFGDYLAAAPERIARIHRSSGTTGTALNIALSLKDANETALIGARAHRAAGLGPGHRVVHCLNYRLWLGGYTDHTTLEATGASVVPFGVGETRLLIRTIRELRITAISATPSYPAVMERVIAEDFPGLHPRDLGLRLGLFGGEAALDDANFRARLEETWGFAARNANYGLSDVLSNFAAETGDDHDLHFLALDALHPELIRPESGVPIPWRTGERGELVLTHLDRECQPLVRFRTGDVILITGTDRTASGLTAPRFRVVGRSDELVVVRGINAFPAQVAAVINQHVALSGEWRIVLEGRGPYDALPVEAELAEIYSSEPPAAIAERVAASFKRELGLTARIRLLPFASLPRTEGKARRVWRQER